MLVEGIGKAAGVQALRRRLGVGDFCAVLIGKDGGDKREMQWREPRAHPHALAPGSGLL